MPDYSIDVEFGGKSYSIDWQGNAPPSEAQVRQIMRGLPGIEGVVEAGEMGQRVGSAKGSTGSKALNMAGLPCHVESGGFRTVTESLNYSSDALKNMFGRHRISLADADKFGRNADHEAHQNALANILYGGEWGAKNLGNTQQGDGWRFRGYKEPPRASFCCINPQM